MDTVRTDRLDVAAFAIANGARLSVAECEWDSYRKKATFIVEGREDEILTAFLSQGKNVNAQSFINARNLLLDIIKQRRRESDGH